jgi:hypothetical protein
MSIECHSSDYASQGTQCRMPLWQPPITRCCMKLHLDYDIQPNCSPPTLSNTMKCTTCLGLKPDPSTSQRTNSPLNGCADAAVKVLVPHCCSDVCNAVRPQLQRSTAANNMLLNAGTSAEPMLITHRNRNLHDAGEP